MNIRSGALIFLAIVGSTAASRASTLPASCGNQNTVIEVATHKHVPVSTVPEPVKAKVFFIETADANALPVTTRIAIDGTWLGANRGKSYFESTIEPGEHHVCADWQLERRMIKDDPHFDVFTAEAGKVYYFHVLVNWIPEIYHDPGSEAHMTLSLSPINVDEGQYMVLNSKLSTSTQKR
jgi:hypothetical protein